jgi:hypothetical protein
MHTCLLQYTGYRYHHAHMSSSVYRVTVSLCTRVVFFSLQGNVIIVLTNTAAEVTGDKAAAA